MKRRRFDIHGIKLSRNENSYFTIPVIPTLSGSEKYPSSLSHLSSAESQLQLFPPTQDFAKERNYTTFFLWFRLSSLV